MTGTSVSIVTDTATICVFDVAAMKHRKDDVGDWWSLPQNELAEGQRGNALFLNLGQDGVYQVETTSLIDPKMPGYCLNTPSGIVFVGPGEEMSGGGFEPAVEWGGFFVPVQSPHQKVTVRRDGSTIALNFQASELFENTFQELIRI